MKIQKTASGSNKITISKAEWLHIGKQAGWGEEGGQPENMTESIPDPDFHNYVSGRGPSVLEKMKSSGNLILLTGEAGSGKSIFAKAFASKNGLSFLQANENVDFGILSSIKKAVILIDSFDMLAKKSGTRNYWEEKKKAEMLNALTTLPSDLNANGSYLVCIANDVNEMPEAIRARFTEIDCTPTDADKAEASSKRHHWENNERSLG